MGNDDQQQTLSFDIRHFTDDQNIQLIKYLGPKGRSIPAIMNIFSASSLFNKPKSEN